MTIRYISAVVVALVCCVEPARAQQGSEESGALSGMHSKDGTTYICGGVGSDEASRMKDALPRYNLMLTFATKDGDFIADVNVAISDARGRLVLSTACEGPIMLIALPKAGRYHVRAETGGHSTVGVVDLGQGAKAKTLPLVWPRDQVEQG